LKPAPIPESLSQLEAFEKLQKLLDLDEAKTKAWVEMIRDARRWSLAADNAVVRVIHLDSNYLIYSLSHESPHQAQIRAWLLAGEVLGISAVAWAEFACGSLSLQDEHAARSFLPHPEAFRADDADKAAQLFNLTGRRSRSLADCMIAAVAIRW
jgi:predicted nucleic acid-binding protein